MWVNTAKHSGSLDCASGVARESDPLIILLQVWPQGSVELWKDVAAWAGGYLGPSRSCLCSFPNSDSGGVGGRGLEVTQSSVCVVGGGGGRRLGRLWGSLLIATDPILAMPGKPQLYSYFPEGPSRTHVDLGEIGGGYIPDQQQVCRLCN